MKKIGEMNVWELAVKLTAAELVITLISMAGIAAGALAKEKIDELKTDRKEDDE